MQLHSTTKAAQISISSTWKYSWQPLHCYIAWWYPLPCLLTHHFLRACTVFLSPLAVNMHSWETKWLNTILAKFSLSTECFDTLIIVLFFLFSHLFVLSWITTTTEVKCMMTLRVKTQHFIRHNTKKHFNHKLIQSQTRRFAPPLTHCVLWNVFVCWRLSMCF